MSTLVQASQQWASRPAEERFTSLVDMRDLMARARAASREKVVASRDLRVVPYGAEGLTVEGKERNPALLSHYCFGQLCSRVSAPAGYLRTLHPALVADNLNYGLTVLKDTQDTGLLLTKSDALPMPTMRAVTGPNYGRIWNADILAGLVNAFGNGIDGDFRVPGEFGKRVEVTKANTTLFASDRDMFVFLADEEHRIEVPNRRDGKAGSMARGFFVWNSEVGDATFGVKTFLFDYVCCNRIVWGAQGIKEIKLRHTASAPHRFLEEVRPMLADFAAASQAPVLGSIKLAQACRIEKVDAFLSTRFAPSMVEPIKAAHMADEGRPIETLWDAVTGATAYARSIPYQADRIKVEEAAGMIIDV